MWQVRGDTSGSHVSFKAMESKNQQCRWFGARSTKQPLRERDQPHVRQEINCITGRRHMETVWSGSGSLGCSRMPALQHKARRVMHSNANPKSRCPIKICSSSLRHSEARPWLVHLPNDPRAATLLHMSRAAQVLHGGPPRKAVTHPWRMACSHLVSVFSLDLVDTISRDTTLMRQPVASRSHSTSPRRRRPEKAWSKMRCLLIGRGMQPGRHPPATISPARPNPADYREQHPRSHDATHVGKAMPQVGKVQKVERVHQGPPKWGHLANEQVSYCI